MAATTIGMVLDDVHAGMIAELRDDLAGAVGRASAPVSPHLTLAVVQGLGPEQLDLAISETARAVRPMTLRIRGVAVVRRHGDGPVVYLPVVRSPELDRCHRELVGRVGVVRIEGHYRPDTWIPHVTVWRGPLSVCSMEIVAAHLASITWTVRLAEVSRLGEVGVDRSFGLGTGEVVDLVDPALDAVGRPLGWEIGPDDQSRSPESAAEA